MALQASPSAPVSSSLTESYPAPSRQNPSTPLRADQYSQSQPSSSNTARPLPSTSKSPQTPSYGNAAHNSPASGPYPPPRSSSNQQRSTSLALATDTQLADRTRPRGNSQGGQSAQSSQGVSYQQQASPAPASTSQHSSSRPADISRGNSEVISRVVIDDPKIDIQREQARAAESIPDSTPQRIVSMPPPSSASVTSDASKPMKRQDFSASAHKRKDGRLGEYILGQTLGEGEFGKVKLGWKKDGSAQVAVKLIRRENLSTNPSRLPKIYREISILGQLSHPNIVKLHEMVETDRFIGIILEYASGGELFDYILTHRYLKDNAARRLFAQLVSGVGYLHKKGIVHRDLKLENLLLDRNRNLMITDFGFANTFDPRDELGYETEENITDKDFVRRNDLERIQHNGFRRGDLMQTSCGSPCYAAPELVVSDSLYTGRKVDVWSCGVILYAMLAGYLPFDDDPANPEGDNINLLYKYICSTPLTFPEYVSPHARDLLRRILVPDPRKRADLFEVARHSWLAEYHHVVDHITKMTTTIDDITPAAPVSLDPQVPPLARSASVREPSKTPQGSRSPAVAITNQSKFDEEKTSSPRDKRRTVQVEYVAPRTQTTRGEASPPAPTTIGIPSTVPGPAPQTSRVPTSAYDRKPLPQDPPVGQAVSTSQGTRTPSAAPARPGRDVPRSTSEHAAFGQNTARPTTGGSMSSASAGRLPSRGNSYSQPLAPTVASTSASGRISQPKGSRQYNISNPMPHPEPYIGDTTQRPTSQRIPATRQGHRTTLSVESRGHKRSTTLGNIFGRTNSIFGGSKPPAAEQRESPRPEKRYPPTSMKMPLPASDSPRVSSESRRRPSFSLTRKTSGTSVSNKSGEKRRFSLLPASFSLKNFGSSSNKGEQFDRAPQRGATASGHPSDSVESMPYTSYQPLPPRSAPQDTIQAPSYPGERGYNAYGATLEPIAVNKTRQTNREYGGSQQSGYGYSSSVPPDVQMSQPSRIPQSATAPDLNAFAAGRYPQGFNDDDTEDGRASAQSTGRPTRVLQKNNRKFADGFQDNSHAGSSGAAKRVMDFFRRRGKARQEGQ